MRKKEKIRLVLIKPSCYDDEGYVVRYFRGVLPSNTLACLASLTEQARREPELRSVDIQVDLIDESVMKVPVHRIRRRHVSKVRTVVALVGVQTHQFPRAADLAREFRKEEIPVLIGGFHVTGQMAMLPETPPEIQELLDLGVTVVLGEVENQWTGLLLEAVRGRLQGLYDFTESKPDLREAPMPVLDSRLVKRFVMSRHGTVDCGRGCPFNCSFCTIINVQGRKMRVRSPESIAAAIRENYAQSRTTFYFFTDDNFARNKSWEAIFDVLIALREEEGIPVEFMMQVDVLSHRIEGFIEKAARAGCSNVFIGMESINEQNLKAAGKRQNRVENYRALIDLYREHEIATHVGYILGFPFDTMDSIREDLRRLIEEIQVDMASFFILTPLPGSRDHFEMFRAGRYMDPDYNRYDSQHEAMEFSNFPEEGSLLNSYQEAWETFYSFENLKKILKRAPRRSYWNLFQNFLWYKSAAIIEKRHPMMTGFLRLKGRKELRPGTEPLSRREYYPRRAKELYQLLLATLELLLEMQFLWLETRPKLATEERVLLELERIRKEASSSSGLSAVQSAYERACASLPNLEVPSRFRLFLRRWNPLSVSTPVISSDEVLSFWSRILRDLRRGKLSNLQPIKVFGRLGQDLPLAIHFLSAWIRHSDSERMGAS